MGMSPHGVSGGRLVELRNSTGPEGRPREGAVADRVQLEVLRPNGAKDYQAIDHDSSGINQVELIPHAAA